MLTRSASSVQQVRVPANPRRAQEQAGKVGGTFRKQLKQITAHLPLARQATLVRHILPRGLWYRAALSISRTQGRIVRQIGGNGEFTTALMLDFWLRELSFGGPFPIPYRITGAEVVRSPGAKLYTWTHLPLTEVPLRVGLEVGGAEPAVVSDPGKVVGQNEFLVFGWSRRIEALPADEHLLGRVKRTLRAGKSVVFLADQLLGGPLSEVPLRVAARLHVPLVYQWANLQPDGVMDVTFQLAPFPMSRTEAEIAANLDFLRERNRVALEGLGLRRD